MQKRNKKDRYEGECKSLAELMSSKDNPRHVVDAVVDASKRLISCKSEIVLAQDDMIKLTLDNGEVPDVDNGEVPDVDKWILTLEKTHNELCNKSKIFCSMHGNVPR